MTTVQRYASGDRDEWDAFVRTSKNGTFLFERAYMDYHADRFADASLLVRDDGGRLLALMPAHRADDVITTHGGLTYGGVVTDTSMTTPLMLQIFRAVCERLAGDGVSRLRYKTVPHIYHSLPAEEDQYCLFRGGARLYRRDVLSVVEYRDVAPVQERRARSLKKARREGLEVRETRDFEQFWPILTRNLQERFGVLPVHSLEEIVMLAGRFPEGIRLFGAFRGQELEAGTVVYVSRNVCHVQYPGTSERGRASGALDLLQQTLIEQFRTQVRYFDFGTSTEQDGRQLNEGLIAFKEGFGARAVMHDMYELDLRHATEALSGV